MFVKKIRKISLVRPVAAAMVLAAFLQCAGCLEMWNRNRQNEFVPARPATFAVGFQQNGKKVPVVGHEVTLDKKPFRMIFYFDRPCTMFVQVSLGPNAVQMARAGVRMDKIIDTSSQISENFYNPTGLLYVYGDNFRRYHNWACSDTDSHRYDKGGITKVSQNKGGGYLCTRTVTGLCIDGRDEKIHNCPSNALYLVFLTAARNEKNHPAETNRNWIIIKFR